MTPLAPTEIRALEEALDDEYRAWCTYDQVIADFGEIRPFSNIREAEGRHIEALLALFARYGLAAPRNRWPGKVARYGARGIPQSAGSLGLAAVGVAPSLNAHFLALAAGAMLFVSVHELVPMAKRYRHPDAFLGGIVLSALLYALLAAATSRLAAP